MDAAELMNLAKANGLYPIPVSLPEDRSESDKIAKFAGSLELFWEAAKALEAKVVFIESLKMEESDFERDDDTGEADDESVNLLALSPALKDYKAFVGKDCMFVLVAKGGMAEIEFTTTNGWWDEFLEKANAAYERWANGQYEKIEAESATQKSADEKALRSLRGLISDPEFCRLRTLRAMLEYAIDRFPELADVDDFVVKPELQTLKAKIEAKGLHRKSGKT